MFWSMGFRHVLVVTDVVMAAVVVIVVVAATAVVTVLRDEIQPRIRNICKTVA